MSAIRATSLEEVRGAFIELMGAERRLRGRSPHKAGGLSPVQIRALFQLDREGEKTAGCLAKTADVSPASMTAMLDQLEADGMVTRRRSEADRRQVIVALTETGREKLAVKRAAWEQAWHTMLEQHSEEELAAAVRVMRSMSGLLDSLGR
jgi:MarR family transcriptional regulator, organic hydroperoxide resistance regulator